MNNSPVAIDFNLMSSLSFCTKTFHPRYTFVVVHCVIDDRYVLLIDNLNDVIQRK